MEQCNAVQVKGFLYTAFKPQISLNMIMWFFYDDHKY